MHILKQATIFEFLNLNIYENFAIFKSPKKIPIMWMDYFFHAAQGLEESRQANEKGFQYFKRVGQAACSETHTQARAQTCALTCAC